MVQHLAIEPEAEALVGEEDRVHTDRVLQVLDRQCGQYGRIQLVASDHHVLVVHAQQVALEHLLLQQPAIGELLGLHLDEVCPVGRLGVAESKHFIVQVVDRKFAGLDKRLLVFDGDCQILLELLLVLEHMDVLVGHHPLQYLVGHLDLVDEDVAELLYAVVDRHHLQQIA